MKGTLLVKDVDSPQARKLLEKRWPKTRKLDPRLVEYVGALIDKVEKRGDQALVELTLKFDGVNLSPDQIKVEPQEVEEAYEKVENNQVRAIEFAKDRIESLEREVMTQMNFTQELSGVKIQRRTNPIRSVGCYVPGGLAAYPSSLVMTATPAKVAGVPRVCVCSPPKAGGTINPISLVAADICGVDEFFKVGGAQAVAALAYGTETILPVEKIVGPGNRYVQAAKILVSKDVAIDLPAGPSEIIVIADQFANPKIVALDLISQAEHGVDGASILLTTSRKLAEMVIQEFERAIKLRSESELEALAPCYILVSRTVERSVDFLNEFAPEHVELMVRDPMDIVDAIKSAGVILIGQYTPVSASDYCFGINHVLPTGGYSQVYSGLSVMEFLKKVNVVECSKKGLSTVRENIQVLAEIEGLINHHIAVEERFRVER